jgi:hypothetical protein
VHPVSEHVAIIVLAAIVAVCLVALVASFKSRLSSAKKEWLELSALLTSYSLPHCAKILEDLAVDDLPGAIRECEYLLRLMRDPKQAALALDGIFTAELPGALADANRRTALAKVLTAWITANPTLAASVGLGTVTPAPIK